MSTFIFQCYWPLPPPKMDMTTTNPAGRLDREHRRAGPVHLQDTAAPPQHHILSDHKMTPAAPEDQLQATQQDQITTPDQKTRDQDTLGQATRVQDTLDRATRVQDTPAHYTLDKDLVDRMETIQDRDLVAHLETT